MFFKYSDSEIKKLLKSLSIQIDTREQQNQHITDFFARKKIDFKVGKLDFGDYSCFLPRNDELGITRDTYFDSYIERKNGLDEFSGNIADGRSRIEDEFLKSKGSRMILMIEEQAGLEKIIEHKYNTQYNEKAYLATLFTFGHRYNIDVHFINPKYAGLFIYSQLYYYVRESLKSEAI